MSPKFNDKTKKKIIFITLVDWKEDDSGVQEAYLNAVQFVIDWSISMDLEVKIVPQVFHEWEDFRSLVSQFKHPPSQVEVINENLDHEELMNLYRSGSFMLATRMRSAIFALSQGCKVICISFDTGAKWNSLLDAGLKDKYLLKMQALKSVDIVKKMNQLSNDSNFHDKIISSYKDNRVKVKEVFSYVLNHK